ncbi:type II toxin-antitoxin system VapC family toxin [Pseudonocardia sp. TRM90224]|uniref:type II toxin-antitoxin system VapC family toxin n=1 Tax=Pseudonocardia sp. TRM90224 TaxID=2812678 RepID=UPI0021031D9A|nr:type II toxin-antitoxin system VapC family toxin [Pseudonocardia sp. TRM90224]
MRLLLDTHVLLWWLGDNGKIGPVTLAAIRNPTTDVFVSAVSSAEISIKKVSGKLEAPDDLPEQVVGNGFTELPLTIEHGRVLADVPRLHGDPFDRLLVAQAQAEQLMLVTADRAMRSYDVQIMAATI